MDSDDSIEDDFLRAAVKHQLLTRAQVEDIQQQSAKVGISVKEAAIRQGHLDGRKLDMLGSLEHPSNVAPGYRVQSILGSGGFGVVYKAIQLNLDRTVALKTIQLAQLQDESTQKRFEREAKIVGQFRHPNIVAAYDFGLHDERLFLSMEYVQGEDADGLIERQGRLDEFTVWQIIRQVSMALAYASEQGVIHRDIKPGNLMLTEAPVGYNLPDNVPLVKVADFGLACFNENHLHDNRLTMADSAIGTPYYMAPEQLTTDDIDERADIYSLGVTAWQLLAGKPPLSEDAPMSIISKKISGDSSWLESPPEHFSQASIQLIRKMCAHDRAHRVENHPRLLSRIDQTLANLLEQSLADTVATADAPPARFNSESKEKKVTRNDYPTAMLPVGGENESYADTFEFSTSAVAPVNEEEKTDERSDRSSFAIYRPIAIILLAATALVFIAYLAVSGSFNLLGSGDNASRRHGGPGVGHAASQDLTEFAGPPTFLFNGSHVPTGQDQSGKWEVDEGLEKGRVLAGKNGSMTFNCFNASNSQPMTYFRFKCGFLHHQSKMIEFHVLTDDLGEIAKILIDRENAVLSELNPDSGQSEIGSQALRQHDEDSQGYHEVRIERQPNYWVAYLDGDLLGHVPTDDTSPAKVKLVVSGPGKGHFEQIRLNPFRE